MNKQRFVGALLAGALTLGTSVEAQVSAGKQIQAKDGDLVIVENADRVRIVRRREANVRAIHDPVRRWVVILVDYVSPGAVPDGVMDTSYHFYDLSGAWPLGDRWEGRATLEDYSVAGDFPPRGLGVSLPAGLLQFLAVSDPRTFADPAAISRLSYRGSSRGGRPLKFDEAERQELAKAMAPRPVSPATPPITQSPAGVQPVRVGGAITQPPKIHDVRPVYPEEALKARITGAVIVEAVIGVDGRVTEARVLKSIPLLDLAALEAVKQWRYEPTLLNGVPVPVIMTVTVSFNLQ